MAIGIYHDTGRFTWETTSEVDFLAMAYLRKNGANMRVIYDYIYLPENSGSTLLKTEDLIIYDGLVKSAEVYQLLPRRYGVTFYVNGDTC